MVPRTRYGLLLFKICSPPLYFHYVQPGGQNLPKTIPALITEALRACDPELRQVLVSNVVLIGGGSLFSGFADRLANELSRSFPHVRNNALLVYRTPIDE